jgi:hypothetical protein
MAGEIPSLLISLMAVPVLYLMARRRKPGSNPMAEPKSPKECQSPRCAERTRRASVHSLARIFPSAAKPQPNGKRRQKYLGQKYLSIARWLMSPQITGISRRRSSSYTCGLKSTTDTFFNKPGAHRANPSNGGQAVQKKPRICIG